MRIKAFFLDIFSNVFFLLFYHCNIMTKKLFITFYFIIIIYFLSCMLFREVHYAWIQQVYSNVTAGKGRSCVFWCEMLINSGYLALNAADLANEAALNPSKMNFRVFNQTHLRISPRPNPAPGERVCISSPLLFLRWPESIWLNVPV